MTTEIAPGAMTTTNKRVRYETTNSNPNDLPSTPSVSANQSPKGCALSSVRSFTVTLRRHLSPIVHKAAESHVDLMHKLMTKMNQFTKMDGDNDFIPRSARLANFEFRVSKKVENSPEFLTIKGETDALVLEFRLKLKQKIMDTLKIECTMLRAELYESLITNIHLVVQAQLITDKSMENPHKIVNTIIEYYYKEIFDHTDLDKDEFIEIYKNTHGLATFPLPPDATPPARSLYPTHGYVSRRVCIPPRRQLPAGRPHPTHRLPPGQTPHPFRVLPPHPSILQPRRGHRSRPLPQETAYG